MDNIGTFACLAIIVIAGIFLFMSARRGPLGAGGNTAAQGPERPTHDNPNVASGGSFGGGQSVGSQTPTYDNPNVSSGGSFGGGQSVGGSAHPVHDNPNVSSGGSFGGGQSVGDQPGRSVGGSSSGASSSGTSSSGFGPTSGHSFPKPGELGFDNKGEQSGAHHNTIGGAFAPNRSGHSLDATPPPAPPAPDANRSSDSDEPQHPSSDNPNVRSGGSFGG